MHGIKIVNKENGNSQVHTFTSCAQRKQWLLEHRFVNGNDVWYHPFTKEIAGLFNDLKSYNSCTNRFKKFSRGVIG